MMLLQSTAVIAALWLLPTSSSFPPNHSFVRHSDIKNFSTTYSTLSPSSNGRKFKIPLAVKSSSSDTSLSNNEQNIQYIKGLLETLSLHLDKWIVSGSLAERTRAYNLIKKIEWESLDKDMAKQAERMASRAGLPLTAPPKASTEEMNKKQWIAKVDLGESSMAKRENDALKRKEWEQTMRNQINGGSSNLDESKENAMKMKYNWDARHPSNQNNKEGGTKDVDDALKENISQGTGRSALSNRISKNGKPDLFMGDVDGTLDPFQFADSKMELENELDRESNYINREEESSNDLANSKTSDLVAKAGAGGAFQGESLGIGGLDDVLSQIKRRIWVPLASPPSLLKELGINPVRGLLLYGPPGCGKTLLARSLGKILSPARPITVVSGPEIMDKFVGSSEKNLRLIFDEPPDIYDTFRIGEKDDGKALSKAALHVIVMDEFDAMARERGGRSGKGGDQGDAGVARDSVVNQLLAKMDGVDSLIVPTLVIGLTNKRTLIETALLRPGRFEVQIEVPPPQTTEQRSSILDVHMNKMFRAGRLLVKDAPLGTTASRRIEFHGSEDVILRYDELLYRIASKCEGMSGASLAGIVRAAASRALERAVFDYAENLGAGGSIEDCLVTEDDFENAILDVLESSRAEEDVSEGNTSVELKEN